MKKELKLNAAQKALLKALRIYISEHIEDYAHQIDEDVDSLVSEGFFKDEADFLAWEYFISHECDKPAIAARELTKIDDLLSQESIAGH